MMFLRTKRHQREQREQRGDGEGRDEVVFVVENFDVERHGVGLAADVAGHHGDRAEFAHRPGVAEKHAVEQAPLDVRQGDAQKVCQPAAPSEIAASSSSLPCSSISGISSRATNGNVTNIVASTMPGHGEDDLDVVRRQPRAEPAVRAEQQHVDEPATTGETENGRSISVTSRLLPRNSNLAIAQAAHDRRRQC